MNISWDNTVSAVAISCPVRESNSLVMRFPFQKIVKKAAINGQKLLSCKQTTVFLRLIHIVKNLTHLSMIISLDYLTGVLSVLIMKYIHGVYK